MDASSSTAAHPPTCMSKFGLVAGVKVSMYITHTLTSHKHTNLFLLPCLRCSAGLRIRVFNFSLKLLTCLLYIIRVMTDNPCASGANLHPGQRANGTNGRSDRKRVV